MALDKSGVVEAKEAKDKDVPSLQPSKKEGLPTSAKNRSKRGWHQTFGVTKRGSCVDGGTPMEFCKIAERLTPECCPLQCLIIMKLGENQGNILGWGHQAPLPLLLSHRWCHPHGLDCCWDETANLPFPWAFSFYS